jgi:hypothetical protein
MPPEMWNAAYDYAGDQSCYNSVSGTSLQLAGDYCADNMAKSQG